MTTPDACQLPITAHDTTRRVKQDPLLLACSLLPLAGLFALYGYALRARVALGAWPAPDAPDPKALGFDLHHGAVGLMLAAALLSPVALGACLFTHRTQPLLRARPMAASLVLYAAAYVALLALLSTDPGSFFGWYFD